MGADRVIVKSEEVRNKHKNSNVRRRSGSRPRERTLEAAREDARKAEVNDTLRPLLGYLGCEEPGHMFIDCMYGEERNRRRMDSHVTLDARRAMVCPHIRFLWPSGPVPT